MLEYSVFLINLEIRKDRLHDATIELEKQGINFERFDAVKHEDGKTGIALSVKKLFENNLDKEVIIVFEDDVKFIFDNAANVMNKCFEQLKNTKWDMLQFGINAFMKLAPFSENVLRVTKSYSLHAVAYSNDCMREVLTLINDNLKDGFISNPLDVLIAENIQPKGNCYCSYPMLASQKAGYSDIECRFIDWKFALENRYNQQIKFLNLI